LIGHDKVLFSRRERNGSKSGLEAIVSELESYKNRERVQARIQLRVEVDERGPRG
jgi:hypothetical protein